MEKGSANYNRPLPASSVTENSQIAANLSSRALATEQALLVAFAFGCLVYSFVSNDFSVQYVAQNSNSRLPLQYRIAGAWGGHEGSLLLWVLMLGVWMSAVALFSRHLS